MVIYEHEGDRAEWECDEYPATPPFLNVFYKDNSGFIYFVYDYDHHDHAVYMFGVANKYSEKSPRHAGFEYVEELFHFDHLYTQLEEEDEEDFRNLANCLSYRTLRYYWNEIKLCEDEKTLILLGKVP